MYARHSVKIVCIGVDVGADGIDKVVVVAHMSVAGRCGIYTLYPEGVPSNSMVDS